MRNVLKKWYHTVFVTLQLLKYNLSQKGSIYSKFKASLLGYELQAYLVYQKRYGKEYKKCFTDRARLLKRRMNPKYNLLLDDKLVNYYYFDGLKMPKIYLVIDEGLSMNQGERLTYDFFNKILQEKKELIVKPVSGAGGVGVYYLRKTQKGFEVNFESELTQKFLKNIQNGKWIVTEFVKQAEYSRNIFPASVNTIRIITLSYKKNLDIVYAVHRFGVLEENPTDNWSKGGISAKIDLDTGVITNSVYNNYGDKISKHPITDKNISGVHIPHWSDIRKHILAVHNKHKYIPMIAWDIAITDKSFKILEMNASSGVQIIQVHEPVYKIEKLNEYYC